MKKYLYFVIGSLFFAGVAYAGTTFIPPSQSGTGINYSTGIQSGSILYGNGNAAMSTSTGLSYDGTRLNVTYASTTAVSAGTFCLTGDTCKTTWPTGTVTSVSGSGGTTGLTLTGGAITTSGTLTLGGTLGVANGGTGAVTLTGCLTGNGTGAITGSGTCNTSAASVTSVAQTVPSFLSISGSPITTSGTLAISYSGTALPIANGGTNATSFTTSGNGVYWNGTSLLTAPLTSAVTYPYASTTALSASGEINIPHSTTVPTMFAGDLYGNTNGTASSSLVIGDGSVANTIFATHSFSMTLASSTLTYYGAFGASGTTTTVIANPLHASTLQSFFCQTDTGTAWVGFTFGSGTETTEVQCTTSGAGITLSSNNTGTGRQAIKVNVGNSASAPNLITITADVEDKN